MQVFVSNFAFKTILNKEIRVINFYRETLQVLYIY